jgi:3-hydroxyisobutyrate dehydrogenase-like beta-hydroxyacid dehydrogenase
METNNLSSRALGSSLRTVGILGLGAMGRPLARSLLGAGYVVLGFDLVEATAAALAPDGLQVAASPRGLAARVDVVLSVLPYADDVRRAYLGEDGAIHGARPGTIFVEASTIDPMTVRDLHGPLAEKSTELLDAGLAGSPRMAAARKLSLLVGGEPAAFERARPVLAALCAEGRLLYTGALGTAKVVKLLNNTLGAIQVAALAEAFNLGRLAGVEPAALFEGLRAGMGNCWALNVRPPAPGLVPGSPADLEFAPDFSVDYMLKDLAYSLQTGRAVGAATLLAGLARSLYQATSDRGEGARDFAAVIHTIEALSRADGNR